MLQAFTLKLVRSHIADMPEISGDIGILIKKNKKREFKLKFVDFPRLFKANSRFLFSFKCF